ncbi:MAG: hypothetical protein AMJ69_01195 [Gammaproteobacteria bacterium SG8_47]|nr:MAG: hypothetical protein AMJ69_01195 [Gammaproteobacteria bacterium SG8_47]
MVPPAAGWRRKTNGITRSQLFLPLVLLVGIFAVLGLSALHDATALGSIHSVYLALVLAGLALVGIVFVYVQQQLLVPLTYLRNWALRMRGGNLSSRIPVPERGEFAELARDINSLSESLQSLSQDMEQQVQQQTARVAKQTRSLKILYDVAASINISSNLDDLLTRFLHILISITGARAGMVRMLTDDRQLRLVSSVGLDESVLAQERVVPINRCNCGAAVTQRGVVVKPNVHGCERYVGRAMFDRDDVELVAVPLEYQGKQLGVYNLFIDAPGLEADADVKELLTTIGQHLGMAIEKTRLDNEARRLSRIEERNMLSHELHDSLAQTLASLRYQVRALEESSRSHTPVAESEVRRLRGGIDEAYTELRNLLAHFRAPAGDHALAPSLETIVANFRRSSGIALFFQNEWRDVDLPETVEMQVLRIIQEALANIRKHSKARTVRILLRVSDNTLHEVLVEDDGIGVDLTQADEHGSVGEHIGLQVMKERAQRLGGDLSIESEPGEGTRIHLTFRYPDHVRQLIGVAQSIL